ncbi:MAG: O-antigen ligase family protein [Candidatus Ornithomonoglobus sp.]
MECLIWYGIFYVYVALSKFWSTKSGIAHTNMITSLIQPVAFFICLDWYVRDERSLDKLIKCFCWATLFYAATVIITSPPSTYMTLSFGSFTGMQRNTTGYILMFGCFFNLFFGAQINKPIYLLFAAVCFIGSILTGSRKIIFGYAAAIALYAIFHKDVSIRIKRIAIIAIILMITIPLAYRIPMIRHAFGDRLRAVFDTSIQDGSVASRDKVKEIAIELFKKYPIFGRGWNAVSRKYIEAFSAERGLYAHNNYLEVAADFGIIGIILFYWKFAYVLLKCIKRVKTNQYASFLSICLIVVFFLDYGQVTYMYLYMMTVFGIMFKLYTIKVKPNIN